MDNNIGPTREKLTGSEAFRPTHHLLTQLKCKRSISRLKSETALTVNQTYTFKNSKRAWRLDNELLDITSLAILSFDLQRMLRA